MKHAVMVSVFLLTVILAAAIQPAPKALPLSTPPGSGASPSLAMANLSVNLAVSRRKVCSGEAVVVSASTGTSQESVGYQWTVNGRPVSEGSRFRFATDGRDPGKYQITVTASGAGRRPASAATTITVIAYKAPAGSAYAYPREVFAGQKSGLRATFHGQCGGPIGPPSFTATEGTVHGDVFDSSSVEFNAVVRSEQRKVVTITATASDQRNSGTCGTSIIVIREASRSPIRLHDLLFSANSARVNYCGRRILLEELRDYYEQDPRGTVVLAGHNSADETLRRLAQERAENAAAVITAASGDCLSIPADQVVVGAPGADWDGVDFEPNICSSSIEGERTGETADAIDRNAEDRRVVVWFVPSGGQLPEFASGYAPAASMNLGALGCPK